MNSSLTNLFRRTTSTGTYYPEIDGLRFIAIALVVLYHLSDRAIRSFKLQGGQDEWANSVRDLFAMGDVGVHLFFAISGYIISKPFLDRYALQSTQTFSLKQYFLRRLTRLEPPYLLVMTGIFLFLSVSGYQTSIAKSYYETSIPLWQSYLASLPYLHGIIFDTGSRLNPPAWSLELEVRFYILAPVLMIAYFSLRRYELARSLLLVGVIGCVLSQAFMFGGHFKSNNFSLFSYIQYFVIGILLCDLHMRRPHEMPSRSFSISIDIMSLAALIIFARSHQWLGYYPVRELVKLLCVIAIFYGAFHGHYFAMMLRNRFISLTGGMCYSIYLIHMPMMQVLVERFAHFLPAQNFALFLLIQAAVILPIILVTSAAFFLLVEKPCMQKDWPQKLSENAKIGITALRNRLTKNVSNPKTFD